VPVLAVLQPREEAIPSGARDLVESGALAAELPDAIVAVHLQHQLPRGTVAAAGGTVNAATDDVEITVEGMGGHAGYPQLAADPVAALCQTVTALQHAVSRRSDPTHAVVVSIGMLEAGQAANVIPATAVARGTLRVLDESDRPGLRRLVREIAEHTCLAHGCRADVTFDEGEPALNNDEALAAAARPWLREAGFTVDASFRSCGADDFSYYTRGERALMLFLGTGGPHALHHPSFLPDDDMVGEAASALLAGYLGAATLSGKHGVTHGGQDV
jgi:amidohydrolase